MHNFVLSPIDPKILIDSIAEKVTANILNAVRTELQPAEQPEQFLNIQEAAEFMNLSVPTMYSKVSRSQIPVMKQGKRLYFSLKELTEYLRNGKKKTTAEIEAEADLYLSKNKKSAVL